SENVFRLWADGTNPSINGIQFGNGSGANWASDADESDWFTKWRTGGEWTRVDWEQRNGLNSFHESATSQTAAPYLTTDSVNTTKI
ncbi:MAG TPA: hypothetical protein PLZ51_02985, partial [Aggregatilineales bacterium]|nr:hypothetical protein [Aggregatilineales bacterium]